MATATDVIAALDASAEPADIGYVSRFYKAGAFPGDVMGVRMPKVFTIAKRFVSMSLEAVAKLLDDARYEVRMAGVSIMDFQARQKKLPSEQREALFNLYLKHHERLDNWDFVDRAAPHVIGEYLVEGDRSLLDRLAVSDSPHERRTALVATHAFIKRGEVEDTFRIAGILAGDPDEFVQKAIGSWVREAGKRDEVALVSYLTAHLHRLPRATVTAATKLLPEEIKRELRDH